MLQCRDGEGIKPALQLSAIQRYQPYIQRQNHTFRKETERFDRQPITRAQGNLWMTFTTSKYIYIMTRLQILA